MPAKRIAAKAPSTSRQITAKPVGAVLTAKLLWVIGEFEATAAPTGSYQSGKSAPRLRRRAVAQQTVGASLLAIFVGQKHRQQAGSYRVHVQI